ncbi:Propeller, partial [Cooperia oncophora]
LSVIDSTGRVFHSTGNSSEWEPDTSLSGAVCSLAHSKLGSWAITCDGLILVKLSNVNNWVTIAAPPDLPPEVTPSQVFSSPNGIYVWILANGRAWARVNINDRSPSGVKWTETYHPSDLCNLAVGDNKVWALDASGRLLRLRGLAAGNPAGNYWRPITGAMLRAISIDAQSELWAVDMDNRLVRHLSDVFVPNQFHSCDIRDSYEFV